MKYFVINDKNVAAIFKLQWKIGNISDMFLQYFVLCGYVFSFCDRWWWIRGRIFTTKNNIIVFFLLCDRYFESDILNYENLITDSQSATVKTSKYYRL